MVLQREAPIYSRMAYSVRSGYHFVKFILLICVLCIVLLMGKVMTRGFLYYFKNRKTRYIVIIFSLSMLVLLAGLVLWILNVSYAGTYLWTGIVGQAVCWLIILIKTIPNNIGGGGGNRW